MESNTQNLDEVTQDAHGSSDGAENTESAVANSVAYETHQRALKQRYAFKERAEVLENELSRYKQQELEAQGKHSELIEAQRKRIAELESETKKRETNYQWNVIGAQIKSELASRGVRTPEKALKYAVAAHKDDLKTIEVDDQYTVNGQDLQRFVDKFLADNVDMGFVGRPKVDDLAPGSVQIGGEGKKPTSKLSSDELMNAWKAAQE